LGTPVEVEGDPTMRRTVEAMREISPIAATIFGPSDPKSVVRDV